MANQRSGAAARPGIERKTARSSAQINTSTSAIMKIWTLIQKPVRTVGKLSTSASQSKKVCWTFFNPSHWVMMISAVMAMMPSAIPTFDRRRAHRTRSVPSRRPFDAQIRRSPIPASGNAISAGTIVKVQHATIASTSAIVARGS